VTSRPTPASPRPNTGAVRLFRALLALYPGEFRDEYGREMALVFADRHRAASTIGGRLVVWLDAISGLLTHAPKEHATMLLQDIRYAVRGLRTDKTFALTVLATLALGIGANTAIFQLIEAVGLRTLPVAAPDRLAEVRIAGGNQGFGINTSYYGHLTRPLWHQLRDQQKAFSTAFAWNINRGRLGDAPELRTISALYVSGDVFGTLGLVPWRGTTVGSAGPDEPCPSQRAMVSHGYWLRELGGRELSASARLRLNGSVTQIVGVTPPSFTGLAVGEQFDVVVPMCLPRGGEQELKREIFEVSVVGRLRPGWTLQQATGHVEALSTGIFEATVPTGYSPAGQARYKAFRLEAAPISTGLSQLRDRFSRPLWLLLGMTGLVLLMASANLANLLLARAAARDGEIAIRLALGGSRPALARQLLAECGVLAAAGAAAGVALAQGLTRVLLWALSTTDGAPALALRVDWRVLAFTAVVATATCLLFGLAPIVRIRRIQAGGALRSSVRGASQDRGRAAIQRMLVTAQMALSLVLVIGALLFVRSFHSLTTFDPGIRRDGITVGMLGYDAEIPRERLSETQRRFVATIKTVPGVLDAGTTTNTPLLGATWGHGVTIGAKEGGANFTWVSPGYFTTMGIRLTEGRLLTLDDTRDSPRVAVVNQTFARELTGGASPIGQTLRTHAEPDYPATDYLIVGVTADTKYSGLAGTTPAMVYAPDSQFPRLGPWSTVMIRSDLPTEPLMRAVKARLRELEPAMVVEWFDFAGAINDGLVGQRLMAMLAGFFGVVAGLVAIVGIYGMVAYGVERRRRELGVRVALGAARWQLVGMVMRQAASLLVVGLGVGTVLGMFGARVVRTMLFGVEPHDPWILAGAAGLLAASALVASYLPARRASRVDPLEALRQE
jgi:predicted permease